MDERYVNAVLLDELRRLRDGAFPDEDIDHHYALEELLDLVNDRIQQLEEWFE